VSGLAAATADARAVGRYMVALRRFLRTPVSPREAISRIERGCGRRETAFLELTRRAVYPYPRSPLMRLLDHCGIEHGDLHALVTAEGLEGALATLYDAGVYVSLEEQNGLAPVRRGSLEFACRPADFDNPLVRGEYETGQGGTRSSGRRIPVDFAHLTHEAGYKALFMRAFEVDGRPHGLWFPVPPGHAGYNNLLCHAKLGRSPDRWFSQSPWELRAWNVKFWGLTALTVLGSRAAGRHLPRPEHVPLGDPAPLARWLDERRQAREPALLETNCSSAVRLCLAARDRGLDLSGTLFRVGGEPFTEAKAEVLAETGARACAQYAMGELGRIGVACAAPAHRDDCHLALDKLAVIQRDRAVKGGIGAVPALSFTTLLPAVPILAINLQSGDYAELERRSCGCSTGRSGLDVHLHSIRSYDKATTEGMNFLGSDLLTLVDDFLPRRFGGGPTDYQLVEHEDAALTRIELVVSPRVAGAVPAEVADAALDFLAVAGGGRRMMIDHWRSADTFRVIVREPRSTPTGKILPLYFQR
jgi:hypothetical protein